MSQRCHHHLSFIACASQNGCRPNSLPQSALVFETFSLVSTMHWENCVTPKELARNTHVFFGEIHLGHEVNLPAHQGIWNLEWISFILRENILFSISDLIFQLMKNTIINIANANLSRLCLQTRFVKQAVLT